MQDDTGGEVQAPEPEPITPENDPLCEKLQGYCRATYRTLLVTGEYGTREATEKVLNGCDLCVRVREALSGT